MFEQFKLIMANQYFDRRMKKVFVQNASTKEIKTFESYLSHNTGLTCDGYAIMGLDNDAYLISGEISISEKRHLKGWVEFKFLNQEFVFDSIYKCIFLKEEWYEDVKPKVKFKLSRKELMESIMDNAQRLGDDCYQIQEIKILDNIYIYYTTDIFKNGKLFLKGDKVKKFIAYSDPSN